MTGVTALAMINDTNLHPHMCKQPDVKKDIRKKGNYFFLAGAFAAFFAAGFAADFTGFFLRSSGTGASSHGLPVPLLR